MTKAILEFNLPEEQSELDSAIYGAKNEVVISKILNILAKVMNKGYFPSHWPEEIKADDNLEIFCERLVCEINELTNWRIE